jgi:PTH1 family peptidyl-tRNA hydrolase
VAGAKATFALVAGLGNVGVRYAGTRHNVGFGYADALAGRLGVSFRRDRKAQGELAQVHAGGRDLRLLKPGQLMNRSGHAVAAVSRFHKLTPQNILVAHDDLDLPAGTVRVKYGGGHGGHNGLRDIAAQLGSRDFWRLRIGIGHPGPGGDVIGYVLKRPTPDERRALDEAIERSIDETDRLIVDGDVEAAMNHLHSSA